MCLVLHRIPYIPFHWLFWKKSIPCVIFVHYPSAQLEMYSTFCSSPPLGHLNPTCEASPTPLFFAFWKGQPRKKVVDRPIHCENFSFSSGRQALHVMVDVSEITLTSCGILPIFYRMLSHSLMLFCPALKHLCQLIRNREIISVPVSWKI